MAYLKIIFLSLFFCLTNPISAKEPSLRDKIGQMLIVGFEGKAVQTSSSIVKDIENFNLGGVILFNSDFHKSNFNKNIESPAQVKELNRKLQAYNHKAELKYHRPDLELLISIDYEGGIVSRLEEKAGFPPTLSALKVGKKPLSDAIVTAAAMAETLKDLNFNLDFAPVVDLDLNSKSKIIRKKERSFSSDPQKVAAFAEVYSKQFQAHKIHCAYKHFPGHGSSKGDSHLGFVDVSASWKSFELKPYELLLNKENSCDMVMIAHVINRKLDSEGFPASLSKKIVTGLLRERLKFKGVIISDDLQMKAIADNYGLKQAIVLSINAGVDMLIFGNNLTSKPVNTKKLIDVIESEVNSGKIDQKRINEAYQHIVNFKKSFSKGSK